MPPADEASWCLRRRCRKHESATTMHKTRLSSTSCRSAEPRTRWKLPTHIVTTGVPAGKRYTHATADGKIQHHAHRRENPLCTIFSLWFVASVCRVVAIRGPSHRWVHRMFPRRRNSATHGEGKGEAIVPHRGSTGAAFSFMVSIPDLKRSLVLIFRESANTRERLVRVTRNFDVHPPPPTNVDAAITLYFPHGIRYRKISNLESLRKLDVLDLHSNTIREIGGLATLQHLRVLNLAGNRIRYDKHHRYCNTVYARLMS